MKNDLQSYNILRSDLKESPQIPRAYYPKITQEDYDKGYIERYFLQKRDTKGAPVYEVKRTVYSNYYTTPFYIGVKLKWRIAGDLVDSYSEMNAFIPSVTTSNKKAIAEAEKVMDDINLYLVNLKQFYIG
jgi:hypothetical protein